MRIRNMALATAGLGLALMAGCSDDDPVVEPPIEGGIEIEGVSAPVSVRIDEFGVPHIRCAVETDCVAGLGYLHARDRFIQMEVRRSFVRGRLSEIVNFPGVVELDKGSRELYSTRDGRPIEEAALEFASERTMALMEAYANGVNAWLGDVREGRNGARWHDELNFALIVKDAIRPWEPEDSLASVVALVDSLTNSYGSEVRVGDALAAMPSDVFDDAVRARPFSTSVILPEYTAPDTKDNALAAGGDTSALADLIHRARRPLARAAALWDASGAIINRSPDRGSNNWVVGPERSASGNALLTNDPHLAHTNPATWYLAYMESTDGTMRVSGVTFAGLPWVLLGQSEHLAWGATTTYFDQADVYIETLSEDGEGVIFNGEVVPFETRVFTFEAASEGTVTHTARYVPHHGVVLGYDAEEGTAVTLRWTGQDLSTDVNFLTELMDATSVEEAREAARGITTLGQNWIFIDRDGNSGWFPYNRLPIRDNITSATNPGWPLDGRGDHEWIGTIPLEALPQAYNRAAGYLATANNPMTDALVDGDPTNDGYPVLQTDTADGFRHERIVDMIEASDEHTPETLLAIVGDTYSLPGFYLVPELLDGDLSGLSDDAAYLRDALDDWGFTCPTGLDSDNPSTANANDDARESLGCLAFHAIYYELLELAIYDDFDFFGWPMAYNGNLLFHLLVQPEILSGYNWWDNPATEDVTEQRDDIVAEAFEAAVTAITTRIGADRDRWQWGRTHTVTLLADLFPEFGITTYNNGPRAVMGGLQTVNVANPNLSTGQYATRNGASMRLNCEGAEAMTCTIQIPGGQVHFRSSPNYDDLFAKWLVNEPIPLRFTHDGIDGGEQVFFVSPGN